MVLKNSASKNLSAVKENAELTSFFYGVGQPCLFPLSSNHINSAG